jgi:hypothetical protein
MDGVVDEPTYKALFAATIALPEPPGPGSVPREVPSFPNAPPNTSPIPPFGNLPGSPPIVVKLPPLVPGLPPVTVQLPPIAARSGAPPIAVPPAQATSTEGERSSATLPIVGLVAAGLTLV